MTALVLLDYTSVAIFALTGALVASRAQLDIVGFAFLACLTGLGGGTLRDLLLNRAPIWIADPTYLGFGCAAAVLVFFSAHLIESRYTAILWLDALALPVAVAAGAGVAASLGFGWPMIVVMGIVTGCGGGLMRDVVANEVPLVLKQGELYVTCALAGSGALACALWLGLPAPIPALACAAVTFLLRAGSLGFGWRLPVYKARPPRNK
ncbi:trimeric intracellular cation channel family protein [Sagittula salina]|uniref:Trimeric intracellular cation channel family protein n=1 Tax=Sagittula salina TaxID=2820268 RepID=A0A940MKW8_9RHOB|nr:trimeric intracellular cation channel family protein [Sagittula salina]MBP0483700.1 trimeric intracellular cation channel family protein [Sagittula salina]